MKLNFIIPAELPSLNEIIDMAKLKRSQYAAYRKLKSEYDFLVHCSCPDPGFKLKYVKEVNITWVSKNARKDKDNIRAGIKFILDGIRHKLLPKDGYNNIGSFNDYFDIDKKNPRVEVELIFNEEDKT